MKLQRRAFGFVVISTVVATLISPSFAAEPATPPAGKTVRLLNVGNSFSNNAMTYLDDLVAADGRNTLINGKAVIGGSSPDKHFDKALLNEKDPEDKNGLYSDGKSLPQYLTEQPWDFITVQQASIKSHDLATYRPHMANLVDYIRKYAPESEIIVHQTWAYRTDDPRFRVTEAKPGEPKTQQEMYEGLTAAYDTIAKELGLRVVPVGDAFYLADTDAKRGFRVDTKFNAKTAKPKQLPNQTHSLHVGWRWTTKDGKTRLGMDGHHANTAGCYLAGCVFYEFLFGNVVGNPFVPEGLDADYARFLQETAHAAVAKRRQK